jgi:hypothetical protein
MTFSVVGAAMFSMATFVLPTHTGLPVRPALGPSMQLTDPSAQLPVSISDDDADATAGTSRMQPPTPTTTGAARGSRTPSVLASPDAQSMSPLFGR